MVLTNIEKILFILFSILIAILDFKTGIIPRTAFLLAFPVFFIINLFQAGYYQGYYPLFIAFTGTFIGLLIFSIAYFISGKRLGKADIWYSAVIGLVLGPVWWYPAIGIACITGIIWIIATGKRSIPFIPCMAIGGISMSFVQGLFK
jgi:prepilin signal peptidase PulO-like enzyme (type II secretory pathway)